MKKIAAIALGLCLIGTVSQAQEHKKLTDDQKKVMKEMTEKYDTNKDGKLDKEEKSKISAEDKEKLEKAGIGGGHHKKGEKTDK